MGQFCDSIDTDEMSIAVASLMDSLGRETRPIARSVVPNLVTGICEILKPDDDEYEDDARQAREALSSLFNTVSLED